MSSAVSRATWKRKPSLEVMRSPRREVPPIIPRRPAGDTRPRRGCDLPGGRGGLCGSRRALKFNNPGLVVDLGVGLWAWPLPIDFDGDGDLDLVVSCPDKPYNGDVLLREPRRRSKVPRVSARKTHQRRRLQRDAVLRRPRGPRARARAGDPRIHADRAGEVGPAARAGQRASQPRPRQPVALRRLRRRRTAWT